MKSSTPIQVLLLIVTLPFAASGLASAQATATVPGPAGSRVKGEFVAEGDAYLAKGAGATTVAFGDPNSSNYRVTFDVKFDPAKANVMSVRVLPDVALESNATKYYASNTQLYAPLESLCVTATPWHFDSSGVAKVGNNTKNFYYAPYASTPALQAAAAKVLTDQGISVGSWKGRWMPVQVEVLDDTAAIWFEGQLVDFVRLPRKAAGCVAIDLYEGQRIRNARSEPIAPSALLVPLDITPVANDKFEKPLTGPKSETSLVSVGGIPFKLAAAGGLDQISLRRAGWCEWKQDPQDYLENYDNGPLIVNDPRMPLIRAAAADYTAVHILAVADEDEKTRPLITMRAGRLNFNSQVVTYDFPARVPRKSEAEKFDAKELLQTPAGPLFHVRVPWSTAAFAQDIGDGIIDVILTKEVRLARHVPDPNRFRYRDLGLPSGVRIAGITFEKSPLQMKVTTSESANAFVQPSVPTIDVRLENITDKEQAYSLVLEATHLYGEKISEKKSGRVKAGTTANLSIKMDAEKRGYYDLTVTLRDGEKQTLLTRQTSFALLPPDTRRHRAESPWGTWDFGPTHYADPDTDRSMSLQAKMGLRYTGGGPYEARKKYGLVMGYEPNIAGGGGQTIKVYEDTLKANPDALKQVMIFHETAVDGDSTLRIPDLFSDWPAYEFPPASKANFDKLWESAVTAAKAVRKDYPDTKITFGNTVLTLREEFYKAKWPREYFDYCGNEAGNFARPPESQPPDVVADNSSFWMDRQLLDFYGYKDKPIQHCYEACYVNTNPGNVSLSDQADYYVRHSLHALAWHFPYIRYAMANDVGNSYYYSNWGASGFCNRYPDVNPKPSYVAMATMTLVLDGAKFIRDVETGSASVYALEFSKPDGTRVWALWTLRGKRSVTIELKEGGKFTLTDDQGNVETLHTHKNRLELTLRTSPIWLSGGAEWVGINLGDSTYSDKPAGKSTLLSTLSTMDEWTLEEQRDPYLEFYTMMCPRRKGDFDFKAVDEFDGRQGVIRVAPRPIKNGKDTMPMYAVLDHKKGVPVPGTPTEVGVWINGNSGFGRVLFEFEDASGQKWTSIGAPSSDAPPAWMSIVVPAELKPRFTPPVLSDWNTDDVFGWSRINFDGWRYVAFPMPGQYPGEGFHWPANSQWRWDKDGLVHYPLTFKRMIIELSEKALHVKTFASPKRAEIYIQNLQVSQGDTEHLKAGPRE